MRGGLAPRLALLSGLAVGLLLAVVPASAHFQLNANIRVVHVLHVDDGLKVYLRLPAPYVLAPAAASGLDRSYTVTQSAAPADGDGDGEPLHRIDVAALRADATSLGQHVADGHPIEPGDSGAPIADVTVLAVRAHAVLVQPPFATLDEAVASFSVPDLTDPASSAEPAPYVGDTVIDVALHYRTDLPTEVYRFSSTLQPGLPAQNETANVLLDYYPGGTSVFRERGLLAEPVVVSRSALAAAGTFVIEGVRHILAGLDHVLFVVCLVAGARRFGELAWRITGFTVGHTVTLALGFFGYVPSGAWFVPVVEAGIALSIIWAGAVALLVAPSGDSVAGWRSHALLPGAVGLLHGLGFSFVLHEILRLDSPQIWQSLLAFNVGVEMGQLAIVAAVFPVLWWLARRAAPVAESARWVLVMPCLGIAAYWVVVRVSLLL